MVVRSSPFQRTFDVERKFDPFTESVNEASPTVIEHGEIELIIGIGLITVKFCELDVPPPGRGLKTVIENGPAVVRFAAGTDALICVVLTNVVIRSVLFQRTLEVETKFDPVRLRMKVLLPTKVEVGEIVFSNGVGLVIEKLVDTEVPPPGMGLNTLIGIIPAEARLVAGTAATNCVLVI